MTSRFFGLSVSVVAVTALLMRQPGRGAEARERR